MIKSENGTLIKYLGSRPKYSILENERKWLLDSSFAERLQSEPYFQIVDKYVSDSRFRIRVETDSNGENTIYKLCKKYGSPAPNSEPITTIYLSSIEFDLLMKLPGQEIIKRRFAFEENDFEYSIDVFEGRHQGLVMAEIEAESVEKLLQIPSPSFAKKEVTGLVEYSGGYLAFS